MSIMYEDNIYGILRKYRLIINNLDKTVDDRFNNRIYTFNNGCIDSINGIFNWKLL